MAVYRSPIAKLIRAYIEHMQTPVAGRRSFPYASATPAAKPEPGRRALEAVIAYMRTALDRISGGRVETIELPAVGDLLERTGGPPLWSDRFPTEASELLHALHQRDVDPEVNGRSAAT